MKRVFNLLVVDESGSMSIIKRHADRKSVV